MTEDLHPTTCDEYADNLAELALGILTGRERATTLAHVDSCPRCAEELEQLSHAADAVVSVAPEIEPTMGFEVRLFNRMGLDEAPVPSAIPPARQQRPARWSERVPRWALAGAAAVIALALGLGIGWSTGSGHSGPTHPQVPSGAGDRRGQPDGQRQHGGQRQHVRRVQALDDRDPGRLVDRREGHLRGRHR